MFRIVPVQCFGIAEDGRGFLKRNGVLLQIALGFSGIPREHICVYTLIRLACQEPGRTCEWIDWTKKRPSTRERRGPEECVKELMSVAVAELVAVFGGDVGRDAAEEADQAGLRGETEVFVGIEDVFDGFEHGVVVERGVGDRSRL